MYDVIILFTIATTGIISTVTLLTIEYLETRHNWIGILEDKKTISYNYKGRTHYYYILIFKKATGKKVKYYVDKKIYNSFNIGDQVAKNKAKYYPEPLKKNAFSENSTAT